jgi:hypothetical protein
MTGEHMTEHNDDDDPSRYFHIPHDPAALPPHLQAQADLLELGIQPAWPDWPGSPARRKD